MAEKLHRDNIICEEEKDIIEYGLDCMVSNLIGISVTVIIGFVFGNFWGAIVLCFMIFPLRKYAGGFHADTKGKCFLLSTGLLCLSCWLFFKLSWTSFGYGIIICTFGGVIWKLSPVENTNKRLDEVEYQFYKRKSRMILVTESLLFLVSFLLQWTGIQRIVAMSVFIVGTVAVAGKVKMRLRH